MALTKVTYGLLSADTSAIDLNIDANTLYVDSSANKVGIQTNSPSLALEVNDTSNVDGEQISIKGHANYGGTVVFRRGDSFNWRVGVGGGSSTNSTIPSSYFGFEQGNTASMVIAHTTGYVGIGTTSPDRQLELEGQGVIRLNADGTSGQVDPGIDFNTAGTNDMQFRYRAASDKLAVYSYGTSSDVLTIQKSNGYVGIGTTSPGYNFQVVGSGDTIASVVAGNSSVAGFNMGSSGTPADGGIRYDNSADKLIFRAGNATKAELSSAGALTLNSAYTFPTADGSANQVLQTDGSGALSFATISTSDSTKLPLSGGTLTGALTTNGVINTGTSHNFAINTPNSLRINIDSDNNSSGEVFVVGHNQTAVDASNGVLFAITAINERVGIGTGAPSEKLEVNLGDIKVQGGANATTRGLIIAHTGQTGNLTMLRQDASGSRAILETTERNLRISAGSSGGTGTSETLDFFTNGVERAHFATNGNFIVGATSGSAEGGKIQVFGDKSYVAQIPQGNMTITDTETPADAGRGGAINFAGTYLDNGTTTSYCSIEAYKEDSTSGNHGGSMVFKTRVNGGQQTEVMRLKSDNSVFVNTTVDSDNQTMRIRQAGSNADPALSLDSDTGDQSYYRYMKFYRKGQTSSVAKLDIDWSGSSIGLAFTSDARLKTVTGEADGLELITRLNPVKYVWKSEPDREGAQGFLAQEVEQAYYETGNSHARGVSRPIDGEEYYMLDDTTLIPNLVKAIKELKDENDALKARVEALES